MKALPMLDHVMFWIARIFLVVVTAFALLPFIGVALNLLTELWMWLVFPNLRDTVLSQSADSLQSLSHRPLFLVALNYAFVWYFAFRLLPGKAARICLGLSSGLLLALFVYSAITVVLLRVSALYSHESFFVGISLYFTFGMIGFASFLWVAIRPTRNFPNSVNSV